MALAVVATIGYGQTPQQRYLAYATYVDPPALRTDLAVDIAVGATGELCATSGLYMMKINPDGSVAYEIPYSTLSGFQIAVPIAVAIDSSGNCYLAGDGTIVPTPGAYQSAKKGSTPMFIMKFDTQGNVSFATYLSGSGGDAPTGITADLHGNLWIAPGR